MGLLSAARHLRQPRSSLTCSRSLVVCLLTEEAKNRGMTFAIVNYVGHCKWEVASAAHPDDTSNTWEFEITAGNNRKGCRETM
jgi:hypothetical protein